LSRPAVDAPHFLIIAGPNGSGKSSAYQHSIATAAGISFRIINPDLLAARIREHEGISLDAANLEAVRRIEAWLETSLLAGHTVGVETVLSTDKYRRLVQLAKRVGYRFHLIYVILDSPERNIERVRLRVRRGGHSVPEDSIVRRYRRSLEQLPWFLDRADEALLYDNSGASVRLIGKKEAGTITLDEAALPAVVEALHALGAT
jgi:predicted ABC-type ATPase